MDDGKRQNCFFKGNKELLVIHHADFAKSFNKEQAHVLRYWGTKEPLKNSMLPLQKTSIYKEFLEISYQIIKLLISQSMVLQKKAEEVIAEILTSIAAGLLDQQKMEGETAQIKENILKLFTIIDLAKTTCKQTKTKDEISKIQQKLIKFSRNIENFQKHRKRVLILSITHGSGHLSASKGVKQGLEALYGYDFMVEIVDFFQVLNASFDKAVHKFYEGSTKHIPSLWQFLFKSTDQKWQVKLLNLLHYPFVASKLTRFFEEKNPDLVISTFPIWDYIAIQIWKKHNPEAKFMSIVTDSISIHSAWATADSDYHIVANKETASSLKKLGVKERKIKILGFPIDLRFMEKINRADFLKKMGLDPKFYTVVFLPTHENIDKTAKTMNELLNKTRDCNLIVITGRNLKLKPKLAKYTHYKNVRVFGWTDELPYFINAADLVITKAGGATVMECVGVKKPMVISQIIPGQEAGNAELVRNYKLGVILPKSRFSISEGIAQIRKNQRQYEKNFDKLANPAAALDIARFIKKII